MEKPRVLYVCTYHGARGLIAEAFTKHLAPGKIEACSSYFEPGKITDLPISVMKEVGLSLPTHSVESVFDRYHKKEVFDYVVTLCHETAMEQCPVFKTSVDALYAKKAERISWSIQDFKSLQGSEEEKKAGAIKIRDKIKSEVLSFLSRIGINTENA